MADHHAYGIKALLDDLFLSVYPPVEWEGMMDAVNRLPVDVVGR